MCNWCTKISLYTTSHAEALHNLITITNSLGAVFCTFTNVPMFFLASLNRQEFTRDLEFSVDTFAADLIVSR